MWPVAQAAPDPRTWGELLTSPYAVVLLLGSIIYFSFVAKAPIFIPRWVFLDMKEDRDRWREMAMRNAVVAKEGVTVGKQGLTTVAQALPVIVEGGRSAQP
jgi:hypothetical protein